MTYYVVYTNFEGEEVKRVSFLTCVDAEKYFYEEPLLPYGGKEGAIGKIFLIREDGAVLNFAYTCYLYDPEHWAEKAKKAYAKRDEMFDLEAKRTMRRVAEIYQDLARRAGVYREKISRPT